MDDIIYLKTICAELGFGSLLSIPEKISSNEYSKSFQVSTENGNYEIKMLNASFTKDKLRIEKLKSSEDLIKKLNSANVPLIMPILIRGRYLQSFDHKYFYIYPIIEGTILSSKELSKEQCRMMGEVLHRIHHIDYQTVPPYTKPFMHIRFRKYLRLAEHKGSSISQVLAENIKLLERSIESCNNAISRLPDVLSITYNSLKCDNVVWNPKFFTLLNPELINYGNPYIELINVAFSFAGGDDNNIDFDLFAAFIDGYYGEMPKPIINWRVICDAALKDKIFGIEDDIKKALLIDYNDLVEQQLAEKRLVKNIKNIAYYSKVKDDLIKKLS